MKFFIGLFPLVVGVTFLNPDIPAFATDDGKPSVQQPEIRLAADPNEPVTLDHGQSMNPNALVVVEDSGTGIRSEERDVYFRGLKLASETPQSTLREAAHKLKGERWKASSKYSKAPLKDFPQFVDMVENPAIYRGRAVSFRGTIRRLTKYDAGENSLGLKEIYEGWIYTADGNSNPTVVLFTSKPPQLSLGSDITDEIRATGYFFKIYGYESQGGASRAPLLLAGTLDWHPGPTPYVFQSLSPPVYILLTLAIFVLGYGMWKANSPGHVERLLPHEEVDLTKLPQANDHS